MNDVIRNGLLLGFVFSVLGVVVFWWSVVRSFATHTVVSVSLSPYVPRFVVALVIGAAVPLVAFIGIRWMLAANLAKHLPPR